MQISSALAGLSPPPKASSSVTPRAPASTATGDAASSSTPPTLSATAQSNAEDPTQAFLDYMKETPAQQLEDSWLASHHLTRKALEAMSPEKRAAIEKQMADDIKRELKQATENKSRVSTNILV